MVNLTDRAKSKKLFDKIKTVKNNNGRFVEQARRRFEDRRVLDRRECIIKGVEVCRTELLKGLPMTDVKLSDEEQRHTITHLRNKVCSEEVQH